MPIINNPDLFCKLFMVNILKMFISTFKGYKIYVRWDKANYPRMKLLVVNDLSAYIIRLVLQICF
jgi:hypothetical protein